MIDLIDVVNDQIDRNIYHGASIALFKGGKWSESYVGTIDGDNPVQPGMLYDLASVSKVVGVGTVVISLVREGKLDIDMPFKHYYPEFHENKLTLRQLLTHSSGINPFIPNRDSLNAEQLKDAINHITVEDKKDFLYTDINFLLLGFMLEKIFDKSLQAIFQEEVFNPFAMSDTSFGPVKNAVPTVAGILDGVVHDPKAKVLGCHSGSAGLFSTVSDLEKMCQHYLTDDFARDIWQNYSRANKERSLAWNKEGDWLDHTGYTGTYVAINRKEQKAAIFLTNRTYAYDDRPLWIEERKKISDWIQENL
ncbi:serine hydrolase domain-containing protein [Streptococcus equinus]|uniref:Beta-lactamase n=1 Tax=Streptococcus equinus ATCC 9812 TaxID=525379 RepID=E8JQD1_STREI|nr:serine hydrolase domain-containing protein [Streptococcus equinus]EFW88614.1 beta-lactamase [Streptococcus equinus ATCC 9812]SUN57677.1 beta-lactamase [Streptococcus equinus]